MAHRIEVSFKIPDTRAKVRKSNLESLGLSCQIENVFWNDVYTIDYDFSNSKLQKIAQNLANPLIHDFSIDRPLLPMDFDFAFEVGFLPGVTDNVGNTATQTIEDLFKWKFPEGKRVYFSVITFLKGKISTEERKMIEESLYNPLIERIQIKSKTELLKQKVLDAVVPIVHLKGSSAPLKINLNLSDEELQEIGKKGILGKNGKRRGPLALSREYLKLIRDYFKKKEKRNPYDIELESIAQTWSEHCKHIIFASPLDEIEEGIYRRYIKGATEKIRKEKGEKDICVSVFKDNSGAIIFDDDYLITDKVETHNSPSALDPFGGAVTGIVGVNRDCIGFGKGAKPVINRYGFCFADPETMQPLYRDKELQHKMLSPKRIMQGVISGVRAGGNESGIPTPCGFIYFDKRYQGKPLVFCGTIGLIPRKINGKLGHLKKARKGDLIVMIGGKVGMDGIHGATFSSEPLDMGSPSTAVQIGDAITQKKFSDALIKEARDLDLYNSITDNGAGGLSCSVAEMARESGGFYVQLEKVPLKYPDLEPWQIWISESQERMTLAVPKEKWPVLDSLMQRRNVSATVIGEFTDSGRCVVEYQGKRIMDMEMRFLHEGLFYSNLKTKESKNRHIEPEFDLPKDFNLAILEMIQRPNLGSYEFISYQFDHEVQGGSVLKPLQGKGKVNAQAFVTRPLLYSFKGVATSFGICPSYGDVESYDMAACAIDTAIRNVIAVGGNLAHLALLDNFCWCSSDDPRRLYQLKQAAKACYDYATYFGTPFISGKDSMYNDFKGYNRAGSQVSISIPPTLLISSIGVIEDVRKCISLDLKFEGDLLYMIGITDNELGGSEYYSYIGEQEKILDCVGKRAPKVEMNLVKSLYETFTTAVQNNLIASAQSVTGGGLAIALIKKALAGKLGAEIDLSLVPRTKKIERDDFLLFSESQSRILVSIDPKKKGQFETMFDGLPYAEIGKVVNNEKILIKGLNGKEIVNCALNKLDQAYRKKFKDF